MKRFPKTEWSGPAWYKLEEDTWNLVYFKPIDLGSHSATEFEGDDLLKVMKEVQSKVPITGCHQGIIHSHHGMGAFHSGTDDKELEDEMDPDDGIVQDTGYGHLWVYTNL